MTVVEMARKAWAGEWVGQGRSPWSRLLRLFLHQLVLIAVLWGCVAALGWLLA